MITLKSHLEAKGISQDTFNGYSAEEKAAMEAEKSAAEIQAMLNDAYMKYVVERELRIAEQDKKDEDEIMALLSLTL